MYETSDYLADLEDERLENAAKAENEAIGNLAERCDELILDLKDANFGHRAARNELAAARAALEKLAAALWVNYNPDLS